MIIFYILILCKIGKCGGYSSGLVAQQLELRICDHEVTGSTSGCATLLFCVSQPYLRITVLLICNAVFYIMLSKRLSFNALTHCINVLMHALTH